MKQKFICEVCGKEYETEEACLACENTCNEEKMKAEEAKRVTEEEIKQRKAAIEDLATDINVTEQDLIREYQNLRDLITEFVKDYPDEDIKVDCPKCSINKAGKRIPNSIKKNYTICDAIEDAFMSLLG